ncbi:hypothetical protein B6E66_03550 [Streptomyces maremycinicus]|nr:hypothetical protein B6E66_03550 [Streptomyces sp. B9173]
MPSARVAVVHDAERLSSRKGAFPGSPVKVVWETGHTGATVRVTWTTSRQLKFRKGWRNCRNRYLFDPLTLASRNPYCLPSISNM